MNDSILVIGEDPHFRKKLLTLLCNKSTLYYKFNRIFGFGLNLYLNVISGIKNDFI